MNIFASLRRTVLISSGLLCCLPGIANADAEVDARELAEVRAKISGLFAEIQPEHVQPGPLDGWYTVRKGAIVAYISGDGRYLMQGDMIDLDEQVNLTDIARNEARVEMLAAIPDEDMITFKPDVVRFKVAVFTDIDCTYCRKLHAQIKEYMANGIEVQYLLYPRGGPASQSWVKAERVWCADNRGEALTLAKADKAFQSHECNSAMVSEHYAMGRDIGLTGTPAIILEDGTLLPGYVPPNQLLAQLAAAEKAAEVAEKAAAN